MLKASTAAEIRSKISDFHTQNVSWYDPAGLESLETPGMSHIVTADASGMAISLTTTINLLFGSQLMVPETGVIMNDEMNVSAITYLFTFYTHRNEIPIYKHLSRKKKAQIPNLPAQPPLPPLFFPPTPHHPANPTP